MICALITRLARLLIIHFDSLTGHIIFGAGKASFATSLDEVQTELCFYCTAVLLAYVFSHIQCLTLHFISYLW